MQGCRTKHGLQGAEPGWGRDARANWAAAPRPLKLWATLISPVAAPVLLHVQAAGAADALTNPDLVATVSPCNMQSGLHECSRSQASLSWAALCSTQPPSLLAHSPQPDLGCCAHSFLHTAPPLPSPSGPGTHQRSLPGPAPDPRPHAPGGAGPRQPEHPAHGGRAPSEAGQGAACGNECRPAAAQSLATDSPGALPTRGRDAGGAAGRLQWAPTTVALWRRLLSSRTNP